MNLSIEGVGCYRGWMDMFILQGAKGLARMFAVCFLWFTQRNTPSQNSFASNSTLIFLGYLRILDTCKSV